MAHSHDPAEYLEMMIEELAQEVADLDYDDVVKGFDSQRDWAEAMLEARAEDYDDDECSRENLIAAHFSLELDNPAHLALANFIKNIFEQKYWGYIEKCGNDDDE